MKNRKADTKDLTEIMNLISLCVRNMEEQGIHQWDEIYPDEKTIISDIEKQELYLLEDEGVLCGIIVLNEYQEPQYKNIDWKYQGKTLVVHRLAIEPSCQRKGYATMLMRFAYMLAKEEHYENIRLDAFINNPAAVRLYEKLEYRKAGILTFRKGDFYCFEKAVDPVRAE